MKEFIDKFAEKVMTTKESFDVKRDNGKVFRYGKPHFKADTFQGYSQDIITDYNSSGTVWYREKTA